MSNPEAITLRLRLIGVVVKRARAQWADCCRNSCLPRDHYPDCTKEKRENALASKALRQLRAANCPKKSEE